MCLSYRKQTTTLIFDRKRVAPSLGAEQSPERAEADFKTIPRHKKSPIPTILLHIQLIEGNLEDLIDHSSRKSCG